jgi:hypothetical protein
VECPTRRTVEWCNGGVVVVEWLNGEMVELLLSCGRMVEWWNGGFWLSSLKGMVDVLSNR